jgi:hypothetical protein
MAIEYDRTTYRTCTGLDTVRFTWCELSKSHVPTQIGEIKQIILSGRAEDNSTYYPTEPRYLGVWRRTDSGELIHLGNSKNAITQIYNTLSIFEFDGIPNDGSGLVLAPLVDANGDWSDVRANDNGEHLGARGNGSDRDGCCVYSPKDNNGVVRRYDIILDIIFTVEYVVEIPDTPDEPTPDTPDEPTPDTPDSPDNPDEPGIEEHVELREVRIEEYWPLIVKNIAEFGQIAVAENPEFNNFAECIFRVLKDAFILEGSEYSVERWEKILGINPSSNASLNNRKSSILTRLSLKVPYTWRVLKQMLVPILGGEDKFVMEYVNDMGKLILHTDRIDESMFATVNDLLARVLPQNIEVVHHNAKAVNENE